MSVPARPPEDQAEMIGLIEKIAREAPRRQSASSDERRAQEIVADLFEAQGLSVEWQPFLFNDNLYANLTLHFGIGLAGTLCLAFAPLLALALHLLAGISYWADSTRRFYLLRRLFGFKPSQNLLATLPAEGEPRVRVVLAAHADAGFTGMMFWPCICRLVSTAKVPRLLGRTLSLATLTMFLLAAFDLAWLFHGPLHAALLAISALLTLPAAATFLFGLEVVLRHRVVVGANDNLSGIAALPVLARRLAQDKPKDTELVFVVTGCEEASLGGADALSREMRGRWSTENTVFLALDGLTNGELRFMEREGEVVSKPVPGWLIQAFERVAAQSPELGPVRAFETPVGGSDAAVFLQRGYSAGALICVDPALGTPRHYHLPSDTPERLDPDQLSRSVEFARRLVRALTIPAAAPA